MKMSVLEQIILLFVCFSAAHANGSVTTVFYPNGQEVTEGGNIVFGFQTDSIVIPGNCEIQANLSPGLADTSDYSFSVTDPSGNVIDTTNSFSFGGSVPTVSVTVSTTVDGDPIEDARITLTCIFFGNQCPPLDGVITILPSGGQGDPHFTQIVTDIRTGDKHRICYDVTGEAGQYIDIVSDKSTNLRVKAQLLDDYYLHKIIVQYPSKTLIFEKRGFFFNNDKVLDWDDERRDNMTFNDLLVKKSSNKFKVINQNNERYIVEVLRVTNSFKLTHLDILISGLGEINAELGGLMGKVNNNLFNFKEMVQESNQIPFEVRKNRRFGRRIVRNGNECVLVNVKDAIFPHFVRNFVKH